MAFGTACALVVVVVRMLEVDAAAGNHSDFFWNWRYRQVIGSNRSVLIFGVFFYRIDSLRNEVLFLDGVEGVFMLP